MSDDRNPGGRGGNGGGLVYLQIDELTLNGKILAEGEIIFEIPVYGCFYRGMAATKDHSLRALSMRTGVRIKCLPTN